MGRDDDAYPGDGTRARADRYAPEPADPVRHPASEYLHEQGKDRGCGEIQADGLDLVALGGQKNGEKGIEHHPCQVCQDHGCHEQAYGGGEYLDETMIARHGRTIPGAPPAIQSWLTHRLHPVCLSRGVDGFIF